MNVMPNIPMLGQKHDIAFSLYVAGLKENALLVTAFEAEEMLNGLTRVDVALTSADAELDLAKIIDRPVTLTVHSKYDPAPRRFSGVVAAVSRGDTGHHRTSYQLTILPPMSRLAHISDSRIFQDLTVPEIVQQLLKEHGIDQVRWNTDARLHQKREYCVMYREPLLAFIERIAAEEGIWTYYLHEEKGRNMVVFIDDSAASPDCEHQKELQYNAMASGAVKGVYCSHLSWREQLRSTAYVQRDYTFKHPTHSLQQRQKARELNGVADHYPIYDYPGRYKHDNVGQPFTKTKMEAIRVDASTGEGIANAPHLTAGHRVKLTDHPNEKLNAAFLILSVKHSGRQPQVLGTDAAASPMGSDVFNPFGLTTGSQATSGLGGAGHGAGLPGAGSNGAGVGAKAAALGSLPLASAQPLKPASHPLPQASSPEMAEATLYGCSFTLMPAQLPYRPPQLIKPLVDGPQMAHVVGPPGEEIYTDEHGRVKVQFPWDRYGKSNDRSSCWIRVAQNWGGASWGHIAIPRIGHEVIVDFLEGDPDQPIIIGRTYHQNNKAPYKLPEHKTRMSIKSKTHKGYGFNELRFEDEKGHEEVFVHAQKDRNEKIKNNHTERIDNNWVQSVGHNKAIEVTNNHDEVIGGNMTLSVGPSSIGQIVNSTFAKLAEGISGIGKAFGLPGLLNPGEGNQTITIEKNKAETVGIASMEAVGISKMSSVGKTYYINVGTKMVITVGKSEISLDKSGYIKITGTRFNFSASGPVQINGKDIDLN